MKLSLLNVLNEGVINFVILQALVIKDLMANTRVHGWFAATNWGVASDNNIVSVIGPDGMKKARELVSKAATKQESSMLYDIPDVMTPYSRTPSAEHVSEMKNSQIYKDVYELYLSYFR